MPASLLPPPPGRLSWTEFVAARKSGETQFFPASADAPTLLVCSHIWWTDQIAFAARNLGYNVLIHCPFYLLYTRADLFARFDHYWNETLAAIRRFDVRAMLGGNSAALLVHPRSRESLHQAAGIPLVNWWWDELRARPPMATWPEGPGLLPDEFIACLKDSHSLQAIWDIDVLEELQAQFAFGNLFHLPLATLPEFWQQRYIPLEQRPLAASFLGNCHFVADWCETEPDPLAVWAREVVHAKRASPDTSMQTHARRAAEARGWKDGVPAGSRFLTGEPWNDFTRPWEFVNAAWMHYSRNLTVQALAGHLKGKLALIGKGWEQLGLRANMEHAQDKSGIVYGQSKAAINLFGGCVHGGMPLRPFDIGASGGLLLTHYQRELPALLEPGRECLAFRNSEEMIEQLDRVLASPADFNAIALAGQKRVSAEHTWSHRLSRLVSEVEARFPGTMAPRAT